MMLYAQKPKKKKDLSKRKENDIYSKCKSICIHHNSQKNKRPDISELPSFQKAWTYISASSVGRAVAEKPNKKIYHHKTHFLHEIHSLRSYDIPPFLLLLCAQCRNLFTKGGKK
ncbi:hypothetical protein PanWU01x14_338020 [Parasponia andersonii]|uniref:Uncharacterized protein n=1 Tax=Parasponia andersonii TaxID=3476 RepID=A0A2P5AFE5_PARAD|nr:hypothetical protein PanWU01x14_338020 [Parasponia andersonii]